VTRDPEHPAERQPGPSAAWAPGWLDEPLRLARQCLEHGDVPVGAAVLGPDGRLLGTGLNVRERDGDPVGHAEILALRAAARALGSWRLDGCTLVATLEPCAMCAGALVQSRVARVVFGAWDDKAGACGSVWDLVRDRAALHRVEVVGGVREAECAALLTDFFEVRRDRG
jgi:tRNA(adenine34) deaminase